MNKWNRTVIKVAKTLARANYNYKKPGTTCCYSAYGARKKARSIVHQYGIEGSIIMLALLNERGIVDRFGVSREDAIRYFTYRAYHCFKRDRVPFPDAILNT